MKLNYIGKFNAPEPEKTALEIANDEAMKIKRQRCAEVQRRYVARKREKEAAEKNPDTTIYIAVSEDILQPAAV
jgi:hypothetical protein